MRATKRVEKAEALREAAMVHAPRERPEWGHFVSALEEAVQKHIGYPERRSLAWDPGEGEFYFESSEYLTLGGESGSNVRGGTVTRTFTIKSGVPIMEALEAVQAEVRAFKLAVGQAGALYRAQAIIEGK